MKLVSLNIWGGHAHEALFDFIAKERSDTDVFCFQEVFSSSRTDIIERGGTRVHILQELAERLPDFLPHFFPMQEHFVAAGRVDFDISVGPATFVRKHVPVSSAGDVVTYGERNGARYDDWTGMPTNFIYVRIPFRGSRLTVLNFYGTPFPGDKLDTPARLEQSQRIVDFVKKEKGEVILCGDFNLMPQTKSIGMIDAVLRNLITASDIKTTRSTISRYYGTSVQQNFADYTFVSHGITVGTLDVPPDCVASDHLPMILTFD